MAKLDWSVTASQVVEGTWKLPAIKTANERSRFDFCGMV